MESVLACFEEIKKTLLDEVQAPGAHLYAQHISIFQTYSVLGQVASKYNSEAIVRKALEIFKVLIDCEEVEFLRENTFADALLDFIGRYSNTGSSLVSVDVEERLIEALFAIASKLRLQPNLLPTWFRPNATTEGRVIVPHTRQDKNAFPLFYLTLNYIHHEGRVGDFARTGLLYIIESACHSELLERWIVESDLATLMASGLGALYSQLSRKLVLAATKDATPAILSFSDLPRPKTPSDAEKTTSPDFQAHLATFLSHLIFWQDVLDHCGSEDIKRSLLDHFKFLFLQQLLYPSLMESSDVDGGSSVAVLTYLRCIIESIDNPELMHLTLRYLLAMPETPEDERRSARPATLARRRKSQTLITNLDQVKEKPRPDLFTLVDLIHTSLQSRNQETVAATLRLVSVILNSQHAFAMSTVLQTRHVKNLPLRTFSAHHKDTAVLFSMAEDLLFHDDLREAYDTHLEDARFLVETHYCTSSLLPLPVSGKESKDLAVPLIQRVDTLEPRSIELSDPLLQALLSLLNDFLANDIATNLGLTQTFATLISCGNIRLEHWFLKEDVDHDLSRERIAISDDGLDEADEDDTITLTNRISNGKPRDKPRRDVSSDSHKVAQSVTPVFAALDSLVQQVETFRQNIEQFDTYLAERRHVFKVGDDIDKDVANGSSAPSRRSEDSGRPTTQHHNKIGNPAPIGVSIRERLLSETSSSSATMSRSSSPRGRQLELFSTPHLVRRLSSHLKISPSRSPSVSKIASRALSTSPLRKGSDTSISSRKVTVTPMGPADALRQKVKIKVKIKANVGAADLQSQSQTETEDVAGSETSSPRSGSVAPDTVKDSTEEFKETTLSHLLTNVIILQEFILELAAIIQVRASLFGEVSLT